MSRILVVDDDPNIRELVRLLLRHEGIDVFEASNGSEALAKLESTRADMVILDIMMSQMDGWELCRTIRAAGETPVFMLTAKGKPAKRSGDSTSIQRMRLRSRERLSGDNRAMGEATSSALGQHPTLPDGRGSDWGDPVKKSQ